MSFILDALRKSESERRRDAAPTLAQIPLAVPRGGPPAWVWAVIATLSACVLVLAGAWWHSMRSAPATPRAAASAAAQARQEPRPDADVPAPAARAATGAATPVAPDTEARSSIAASGASVRVLPSVADALAAGIALPPLDLQLISYREAPAERFVFINGFQYRQGQRVQNGPLVVAIHAQGVVLRQQGFDFVLVPD